MEELLNKLNIFLDGDYSKDGSYVIDIYDSDEFGRVYSNLENNKDVEELYDNSLLNVHNANVSYLSGDYQLTLIADFDNDQYKLVITEYEYVEDDDEEEDN